MKKPFADVERSVLEEFGRCLEAIIDSAHRTKGKAAEHVEKKPTPASFPAERAASRRAKTARRVLNL